MCLKEGGPQSRRGSTPFIHNSVMPKPPAPTEGHPTKPSQSGNFAPGDPLKRGSPQGWRAGGQGRGFGLANHGARICKHHQRGRCCRLLVPGGVGSCACIDGWSASVGHASVLYHDLCSFLHHVRFCWSARWGTASVMASAGHVRSRDELRGIP